MNTFTKTTETVDMKQNNMPSSEVYNVMEKRFDELEKAELSRNHDPAEIEKIKNKYYIIRVTGKYGVLLSMISIYDGFNEAFLKSSDNRHRFLGQESIKVCVDEKETIGELGKIVGKNEKIYDQLHYPNWIEWKGCGMVIPQKAHIVLDPNATWPTLYMKSNKSSNGKNYEVAIYERAWDIDCIVSDNDLVKQIKNYNEHAIDTPISKKQCEFNKVSLRIKEKLEAFDILVEIPFFTPRVDVLTSIEFDDTESIILTLT